MKFITDFYDEEVREQLFSEERVRFAEFIKFLDDQSMFDYSKQEYKQSLELFDQEKGGKTADVDDIKRVLHTYSSLSEHEIEHYLNLNIEEGQSLEKGIRIKESVNTMYRV